MFLFHFSFDADLCSSSRPQSVHWQCESYNIYIFFCFLFHHLSIAEVTLRLSELLCIVILIFGVIFLSANFLHFSFVCFFFSTQLTVDVLVSNLCHHFILWLHGLINWMVSINVRKKNTIIIILANTEKFIIKTNRPLNSLEYVTKPLHKSGEWPWNDRDEELVIMIIEELHMKSRWICVN